jgi:hypothetical protein
VAPGPSIKRARVSRIVRIADVWCEADVMAACVPGSTRRMAAVVAKGGRIEWCDPVPARFDGIVVFTTGKR